MPIINRPTFFTVALSLILSLFCLPMARATFASCNLHRAQRGGDHSPAYKEGMETLSGGAYEKAAELFKQAAADKPDDMWAFYYFGLCLLRLKRFDEAAKAYQQAIVIKPNEAMVHYQLCKIYLEMGVSDAAEKEYSWLQEHDKELAMYLSGDMPKIVRAIQVLENKNARNAPVSSTNDKRTIEPMDADLRPTILYREKAKYTEIARINLVQGTVVLQAVFAVNGKIQDIRVVRGLPDGLTHKAIEATRKIRFNPATRNGEPVSVRGALEFTFNLY
jgi:TonB family protein